jgi:hypothetical protein
MLEETTPERIAENEEELKGWSDELKSLQALLPLEASIERLRKEEIPSIERNIEQSNEDLPDLTQAAEEVCFHTLELSRYAHVLYYRSKLSSATQKRK